MSIFKFFLPTLLRELLPPNEPSDSCLVILGVAFIVLEMAADFYF